MRLPDFLRTSTFRLAATFAVIFAASAALLFAFIYWQTAMHETGRIDRFITQNAATIAGETPAEIEQAVSLRILGDLHRISFAALFDPEGHLKVGNLKEIPPGLPVDGMAHEADALRVDGTLDVEAARAVARRLPDGDLLVIGRNVEELTALRQVVARALELGVIPAMLLSLLAGAFVSRRAQQRVKAVHRSAARILAGDLRERLPTRGTGDDFDRLAGSVNRMLDKIGRLLESVKAAGDDIAHDLRTPLTRVRTRLERGRGPDETHQDLRQTVAAAISDLDQALSVITTLLRIGEIEAGQQRNSFETVDLGALVEEVGQIYQPLAEDKQIGLETSAAAGLEITADPGLLLEAIANLVQNAIKFTPAGGRVLLSAETTTDGPTVIVTDTGPGIPPAERELVFDRFYRIDKSRHIEGTGLGLSLVASIAKLHGCRVSIEDGAPGAVFRMTCGVAR